MTQPKPRSRALAALPFLALLALALAVRLPERDAFADVDAAHFWQSRTAQFWDALEDGRWWATRRAHHPGVTLMWLAGGSMKAAGVLGGGLTPATLRAAVLPVALLGALIAALSFALLRALLPDGHRGAAAWTGLLIATEPFLVAHSRTFHLDMLLAGFAWLAVLAAAWTLRFRSAPAALACGALLALAGLAKVTAAAIAAGVASWFLLDLVRGRERRQTARLLFLVVVSALLVSFLLWPALLVRPVATLRFLSRRAHQEALIHKSVVSFYYGAVVLLRVTPEVLLGLCGSLLLLRGRASAASPASRLAGGVLLSYAPFLAVVALSPHKADRYLLPFFPPLCILAALGAEAAWNAWPASASRRGGRLALALSAAVLGIRLERLAAVHPLPITWCARFPGLQAESTIGLGSGEGMKEAALWIRERCGHRPPQIFAGPIGRTMQPWLRFDTVPPAEAELIVVYSIRDPKERKLERWGARALVHGRQPLHEVWLAGRRYVQIFAGPRAVDAGVPPAPSAEQAPDHPA